MSPTSPVQIGRKVTLRGSAPYPSSRIIRLSGEATGGLRGVQGSHDPVFLLFSASARPWGVQLTPHAVRPGPIAAPATVLFLFQSGRSRRNARKARLAVLGGLESSRQASATHTRWKRKPTRFGSFNTRKGRNRLATRPGVGRTGLRCRPPQSKTLSSSYLIDPGVRQHLTPAF